MLMRSYVNSSSQNSGVIYTTEFNVKQSLDTVTRVLVTSLTAGAANTHAQAWFEVQEFCFESATKEKLSQVVVIVGSSSRSRNSTSGGSSSSSGGFVATHIIHFYAQSHFHTHTPSHPMCNHFSPHLMIFVSGQKISLYIYCSNSRGQILEIFSQLLSLMAVFLPFFPTSTVRKTLLVHWRH